MGKRRCFFSSILPENIISEIRNYNVEPLFLPPSSSLKSELKYHPDIICSKIKGVFYSEKCHNMSFDAIELKNIDINLNDKYPGDCVFNYFKYNKYIFLKNDYILKYEENFEVIKLKQGYSKCSTIILGQDSFITSDKNIYKNLIDLKYNVLLTENDNIYLNGFSNGFIGGAAFLLDEKLLAFTGDIKSHSMNEQIISFCKNIGIGVVSLSNDKLYDYGGCHII